MMKNNIYEYYYEKWGGAILDKSSKLTKANEKQYFVYASMEMYCNTFGIPIKELLEDVPKGTEPKLFLEC